MKGRLLDISVLGFPGGSEGKEFACNVGDLGSIPGLGRPLWRKEWLPTPVFWPGEFHGHRKACVAWVQDGRLQSMGSQRFGHDWVTSTFFHRNIS